MILSREARAELSREYVEQKPDAGIYRITHITTGKTLLGSSINLQGPLNRHRFMLRIGAHPVKALQADYTRDGEQAFVFEVVARVERREEPNSNPEDELCLLEQLWLERDPIVGPRSYNEHARIRDL